MVARTTAAVLALSDGLWQDYFNKQNLTKGYEYMRKSAKSSIIAIIFGYLGSGFGAEIMNWPQLGPILAIVVMGSAIITSLEKEK